MQKFRKNIFEELEKVKDLVLNTVPEFEMTSFSSVLGKIGTYHYNKRNKMLLGKERKIYNILIENSYNPFTVYKWSLLENIPEEIRYQLEHGFISQKKASKLVTKRKRETDSSLMIDIKKRGLMLVRGM